MHTVEIHLNPSDLRQEMNNMREWLDERGFEPSVFASRQNGSTMLVSISFKIGEESQAFANRFAGGPPGVHTQSPI